MEVKHMSGSAERKGMWQLNTKRHLASLWQVNETPAAKSRHGDTQPGRSSASSAAWLSCISVTESNHNIPFLPCPQLVLNSPDSSSASGGQSHQISWQ